MSTHTRQRRFARHGAGRSLRSAEGERPRRCGFRRATWSDEQRLTWRCRVVIDVIAVLMILLGENTMSAAGDKLILKAATFYASFDEELKGDFGAGRLDVSTRRDHPTEQGQFLVDKGFDSKVFGIAAGQGVHGGALRASDVLPQRGRLFFPAEGNLAFDPKGWAGTVSLWINTNPDTDLKTPFCDPVQITQKGANDGGLWIDFPDSKPRDMRMGAFPAAPDGQKPIQESAPDAPLVPLKSAGFKAGEWHHLAIAWRNFDTGHENAESILYVDSKRIGSLHDRAIAMRWDPARTGIYVAVNFIGLLDEFALFNRPLTAGEIERLHAAPGLLSDLK